MALPTLQPYFSTRGHQGAGREARYVRRTVNEDDFKQKWAEHSRYFKSTDARSQRQEAWTSKQCFQDSMTAYQAQRGKKDRSGRLQERREQLRTLLEEERILHQKELKLTPTDQVNQMRDKANELKAAKEDRRKLVADEKMKELQRANCPQLREVESRMMQRAAQDHWSVQQEERRRIAEQERQEQERYELEREEERLQALELEEEDQRRRKMTEKERAKSLKRQMLAVKAREEEAVILEQQQADLMRQQIELEEAEEERKQLEQQQKRAELGRMLVRQARAQLRRKSQLVQEALELDLKILEDLAIKEREEAALQTARREKAMSDARSMLKVVEKQLELERRREAELDMLYQEEAAKMWSKREAEWEKEAKARERLMNEVMEERRNQIDRRLEVLKSKQAESIEQREELLRDLELAGQQTARESKKKQELQTKTLHDLNTQLSERRRREEDARLEYERELMEQREREEEYDEFVREEEERMTTRGYAPTTRRRYAWH